MNPPGPDDSARVPTRPPVGAMPLIRTIAADDAGRFAPARAKAARLHGLSRIARAMRPLQLPGPCAGHWPATCIGEGEQAHAA